jgi:hypothetical protein
MSNEAQPRSKPRPVGGRRRSTVLPEGYSWLSVPVPTAALDNLHVQSRRSNLGFREFVRLWAMDAFPYNQDPGLPTAPEPAPAPAN